METLGEYAYQAIYRHFRKAIKQEAAILEQEPEAFHQMRVGLRRLRSALEVFSFALKLPKAASAKQARKIAAILGQVRDLDVLQATLKTEYQPYVPETEQAQLMELLEQLERERQQQFKQVSKLLNSHSYAEFKAGFQSWLKHPSYQPAAELPIGTVVADLMLPLVSQLLLHPAWVLGEVAGTATRDIAGVSTITSDSAQLDPLQQIRGSEAEVLHELRKQIKRVRYQAELFSPLYPSAFQAQIQNWADLQELLGKIHDDAVLEDRLTQIAATQRHKQDKYKQNKQAKHQGRKHVKFAHLPELGHLRFARQQQFWQQWQQVQPQYLNADYRQNLRLLVLDSQDASDLYLEPERELQTYNLPCTR